MKNFKKCKKYIKIKNIREIKMSVTSSANLDDFHVGNTVVSAQTVSSVLGPSLVEALAFQSACNPNPALALVSGTATYTLLLEDYVQALVGEQQLDASNWATTNATLSVGADTAVNAANFIRLFGLTSANPWRVLTFRFVNTANATTPSLTLSIANTSGSTNSYVKCLSWTDATSYTAVMADSQKNRNGCLRKVQVRGVTFTEDAEVVQFQVVSDPATILY